MPAWRSLLLASLMSTAVPLVADAQSTACPLNFTAASPSVGTATFHWSGFGGADGYQVFGVQGAGNATAYSPMLSGDARDATASSLPSGSYVFWVEAFHSGSLVAQSCQVALDLGPGLAKACPDNVTASAGVDAVELQWDPVANATGYRVARAVGSAAWDDNYATSTTTTFVDTNVTPGSTYHYRVATRNTRLPPAACGTVTATVPDGVVPFFPSSASMALAVVGTAIVVGVAIARRR